MAALYNIQWCEHRCWRQGEHATSISSAGTDYLLMETECRESVNEVPGT